MKSINELQLSIRISVILAALGFLMSAGPSFAVNNNYAPAISSGNVVSYLENPASATAYKFGLADDASNSMDSPSVIDTPGVSVGGNTYNYSAVYHTSVSGVLNLNLAVSNDLITWHYVRTLLTNADMPKIVHVSGSSWIMLVHEKWTSSGGVSVCPCQVAYELFYDASDLISGTIDNTWTAPQFSAYNLDGTPSVYNASLVLSGGYYVVNGQYGFHEYNGTRDINAVTTITELFGPSGPTSSPSVATGYNSVISSAGSGVAGAIGQRDTLQTTTARYNLQEGDQYASDPNYLYWGIYLYTFGDSYSYPTGASPASATKLAISTPNGSTSFGNPNISVVSSPSGTGYSLVVGYELFYQGAGTGEAGSLLYYYDIP